MALEPQFLPRPLVVAADPPEFLSAVLLVTTFALDERSVLERCGYQFTMIGT